MTKKMQKLQLDYGASKIRENLNIDLNKYIDQIKIEYPFLTENEIKELLAELYVFVENFYFLHIEK